MNYILFFNTCKNSEVQFLNCYIKCERDFDMHGFNRFQLYGKY